MKLTISTGYSRLCTDWRPKNIEWGALVEKLASPVRTKETLIEYSEMPARERGNIKDVGGFIGGHVTGRKLKDNVKSRSMITLDVDNAPADLWEQLCMGYDGAACLYSTHSSTEREPRYRLIIPLSRNVTPQEYEAAARQWAREYDVLKYCDVTTFQPERLMYWPSVCCDAEYIFESQEGDFLNPDDVLGQYKDWTNEAEWPRLTEEKVAARNRGTGKKRPDPRQKPGIVGAFCRTFSISSAIDTYLSEIYEYEGGNRYHLISSRSVAGARSYDDDTQFISDHATDPYHGIEMNAFDLVRLHLFGKLDEGVNKDTPITEYPSYEKMKFLCLDNPDVRREMRRAAEVSYDAATGKPSFDMIKDFTDQNVARMIANRYKKELMYNPTLGWLHWDGKTWKSNAEPASMECQFDFSDELMAEAIDELVEAELIGTDKTLKFAQAYHKKISSIRSGGKIQSIHNLVKAMCPLEDVNKLNPDPWLLNTPDKVINLKTGEEVPRSSDLMMSHITLVTPKEGPHPLWDSCLDYWSQDSKGQPDKELQTYLQMIAGLCCIGEMCTEGMIMVYGDGGNGKSTMWNTLYDLLNDYAKTLSPSALIQSYGGAAASDFKIATLFGARMVLMGELDEDAKLSIATMKNITSRDVIQANPKGKALFSFTPSHTLILYTNHLPKLLQNDAGTKRRIAIVPFQAPMKSKDEMILDLKERLIAEEGPQILQWMIDGARMYWENNRRLNIPDRVERATCAYQDAEDLLGQFLRDRCITDKKYLPAGERLEVKSQVLIDAINEWLTNERERPWAARTINNKLQARGFSLRKTNAGNFWEGLALRKDVETDKYDI